MMDLSSMVRRGFPEWCMTTGHCNTRLSVEPYRDEFRTVFAVRAFEDGAEPVVVGEFNRYSDAEFFKQAYLMFRDLAQPDRIDWIFPK